jgi:copper resistance protein B
MTTSLQSLVRVLLAALITACAQAQEHEHKQVPAPAEHVHEDHASMQVPAPTDADRAAAFPEVQSHAAHDNAIHSFLLLDHLEGWDTGSGQSLHWEVETWMGTDLDRLWLRSDGERVQGHTQAATLEVLYGRSVATWWDVLVGVRHDPQPGDSRSYAALGVRGLAPQRVGIEATAYVGGQQRTAARLSVEYDLLFTNRLVLQPQVQVELHGRDDPARGIGSGFSHGEAALRLRYEITRRLAPYLGLVYQRSFGDTASIRRALGDPVDDLSAVLGLRTWF